MRVLLITKSFPPVSCGVGDYASRLAEELTAAGNGVTVLTAPADAPRHFSSSLREQPLRGWRDLRPAIEAIVASAPDHVQLEYSGYAWGRWGFAWWLNALLFCLRLRRISVHVGLHELAISMRQHPLQTPVALAQWFHIALTLGAVNSAAVNMRSRVSSLERFFPWWREKIRYRPNSSNIPVIRYSEAERADYRRERGVSTGELVVATFGLFHPAKNYEALIEAVSLVRGSRTVRLWMLGNFAVASPEYIARLKNTEHAAGIQDAVWWSGRLEAADISRALQSADVFVLPQPDGHLTRSGAFMAAAAHGLPVVAVRQPGGRDQAEFTHAEHLWLAKQSTGEEFAAAIRQLAGDPAGAERMGRNLQELYAARFDWPIAAAAFRRADAVPPESASDESSVERGPVAAVTHPGGTRT